MNKKIGLVVLCFSLSFATLLSLDLRNAHAVAQAGNTLVLYDAASGNTPNTEMMNFIDFPPGAAPAIYENGMTLLDTSTSGDETYAGWVSNGASTAGFPLLDQAAGFEVNFSVQVENESHSNNNRAGFSLIVLGSDARGIEVAFWRNEIWAQNDDLTGGLFTHGEAATFDTTAGLINYQLNIVDDAYTLNTNGLSILTGPVRDYSNFEGFPDPYQSPNFLFIGDNTTSAQSRLRLAYVSVTGTGTSSPTNTPSPTDTPTNTLTNTPAATPTNTPTNKGFEPYCLSHAMTLVIVIIALLRPGLRSVSL
jgi:hypothetical protein